MSRASFRARSSAPPGSPALPAAAADDLLGRGYSRRQLFRIAAAFSSVCVFPHRANAWRTGIRSRAGSGSRSRRTTCIWRKNAAPLAGLRGRQCVRE